MIYLWLKALHLISMVAWFAGLFYLPRLFVYHAMTTDQLGKDRFKIMERKLYKGIMLPASITTTLVGLGMLHINPNWLQMGWMKIKLVLIAGLWIYQFWLNQLRHALANEQSQHNHVFFRWVNEIPTLILIAIILLAVLKPF